MIESGIVGRPVYTIDGREFAATQEGTLHFQHLKNVEGGLLHLAADLDEHVAQLAQLLTGRRRRASARAWVHPGVHPAAWPRRRGDTARGRGDRTLRGRRRSSRPQTASLVDASDPRRRLCRRPSLATVMTMERAKLRSIVLHWTRPARLALRGLVSRLIYAARFVRRLPGLASSSASSRCSSVCLSCRHAGCSIAARCGLHAVSDVAQGRAGSGAIADADLPVGAAPGFVPGLRAGHSRTGCARTPRFTLPSAAPSRWAGRRRSMPCLPIIR